jgi:hypothetical protein
VAVHDQPPRHWDAFTRRTLGRCAITPLTLDPVPDEAVDWAVALITHPITRRRHEAVRIEIGYAVDASRAYPWWVFTNVRDTWLPDADDERIARLVGADAQAWLAMWSVELPPSGKPAAEHRVEVERRMQEDLAHHPTTITIDGVVHPATEIRVPDHRAVFADVPALGLAVQVFLRRDDRDPIAVRSITIDHPPRDL